MARHNMNSLSKVLTVLIIISSVEYNVDSFSQQRQCPSKPMNVDIILDLSYLRDVTDMTNIRRYAIAAETLLPINSSIRVTAIERDKTREIGTFIKTVDSSKSFEQSMYTFNDYANGRPHARFSTVKDIAEEIKPWTDPKLAYIVIVIGNGGVEFDSPKRNLLKITYVIHVMDAPTTWDEMASDPDHVINPDGLTTDTVKLKALLCEDSHLFCNTDEFMRGNTHFCSPCKDICKSGQDEYYCKDVCKYFRRPMPATTPTPPPVVNPGGASQAPPTTGQLDPKVIVMIVIVAVVLVVLVVCATACWCPCGSRSGNTLRMLQKAFRRRLGCMQQQRPDSLAQQATDCEGIGDTAAEEGHTPDDKDTTPLKHADDPPTNVAIVCVTEQNHIALDEMIDLGSGRRGPTEPQRQ